MRIVTDSEGQLRALDWDDHEDRLNRLLRMHYGTGFRLEPGSETSTARRALDAYFGGQLSAIERCRSPPAAPSSSARSGPPCAAYARAKQRATDAGGADRPDKAVRAVGMANNKNPIAIVVPCHRVIGAHGGLTGYGGGLERKLWLLRHEGALL